MRLTETSGSARIRIHLKMSDKGRAGYITPHISISKEKVLAALGCKEVSATEAVSCCYDEVVREVTKLLKPSAALVKGAIRLAGQKADVDVVCEVRTVGDAIDSYIAAAFKDGSSMRAMLAGAIADEALFSMDVTICDELKMMCRRLHLGISGRLAVPDDIEPDSYRMLIEAAGRQIGAVLTDGLMLEPVKTLCNLYVLTDDADMFNAAHNCSSCGNLKCSRRLVSQACAASVPMAAAASSAVPAASFGEGKICIKVAADGGISEVLCDAGETVMHMLSRLNPKYEAVCGGTGRCGKCKIQVLDKELPVSMADRRCFTKKELLSGWRLACMAVVTEALTVRPAMTDVTASAVLTETNVAVAQPQKPGTQAVPFAPRQSEAWGLESSEKRASMCSSFCFGIDIGTTTIAIGLYAGDDGRCIDTYTALNRQRIYGADVISRIQQAVAGNAARERELVIEDISEGLESLAKKYLKPSDNVGHIAIAANTTMLHLLLGYPCDGLGHAPFLPYKRESVSFEADRVFEGIKKFEMPVFEKAQVLIYPGISAFVGADIVAGMTALRMGRADAVDLLIDLGTNGEMAIGNKNRLLVASAAAGPAFEGGNITWGTGSVAGAICRAEFKDGKLLTETIGGAAPLGICGTGIVEVIHELLSAGLLDETGLLDEKYFDCGYPLAQTDDGRTITLTQKDIREFQMAKASICAGVETLLEMYEITAADISRVCIAGGFGYGLNYKKAAAIGLLPEGFETKVCPAGNTALAGAALLALHPEAIKSAEALADAAHEISLADSEAFQNHYIKNMYFSK